MFGCIDWFIVFTLIGFIGASAFGVRKYARTVTGFLAAERCAGRYLLTISDGMAGLCAITIVGYFEMYYKSGFSALWWNSLGLMTLILINSSGWIIYRFRQTRALTLAEFLETRYSKRFRIFAGVVAWISGIINFGIFPSVGARFFIYFCGLPENFAISGIVFSTYVVAVITLVFIALLLTFGGQLTVMVTDFLQGTFFNFALVAILIWCLKIFSWVDITAALEAHSEKGASLINPFMTSDAKDFNITFYLIQAFIFLYAANIWQGNQGYNCCSLTPHEARMGRLLGVWRLVSLTLFFVIIPVVAHTIMNSPSFSNVAVQVDQSLTSIENPQIQKQMMTPLILSYALPAGLLGIFASMVLFAFISTHDTYLHSWGTLFVQDVILPLYGKELSNRAHMLLLKLSIVFVAMFICIFSILFRQTDYILMFFNITGAIFVGGAGIVVIGGLYWKYGTTTAAWVAMITGAALSVGGVVLRQFYVSGMLDGGGILLRIGSMNSAIIGFWASVLAILSYIAVSLIERKQPVNMDKLLHRGEYAVDEDKVETSAPAKKFLPGITEEFSMSDKVLYLATLGFVGLWIIIFVAGTVYNFLVDVDNSVWSNFWRIYFHISFVLTIIITIWFLIGGIGDIRKMFVKLKGDAKKMGND